VVEIGRQGQMEVLAARRWGWVAVQAGGRGQGQVSVPTDGRAAVRVAGVSGSGGALGSGDERQHEDERHGMTARALVRWR
jgi:hypothetical protein